MKCDKCGYENNEGNFCEKCGEPLGTIDEAAEDIVEEASDSSSEGVSTDELLEMLGQIDDGTGDEPEETPEIESEDVFGNDTEAELFGEEEADPVAKEALDNLKKYEEGTITHPSEKPKEKKKGKFYCPQNPMLWAFVWLLLFGIVLGALSVFFFNVDIDGKQIIFGIAFSVFTLAVLGINFVYYFPAALALDKLLKGKGVRLEYKLKNYELVDLAEEAKKKNRPFYLAIALFGLAFSIYYIYILASAMVKTNLMWISLYFSIGVFVIFALLFFIMPKFNYERMMQNGERVIVGSRSVYYGGTYYHWRGIKPEATFGTLNTKKHKLDITFVQEQKDGTSKRRKVEMYAPDSALKEITRLLGEYEEASKKYREDKSKKQRKEAK